MDGECLGKHVHGQSTGDTGKGQFILSLSRNTQQRWVRPEVMASVTNCFSLPVRYQKGQCVPGDSRSALAGAPLTLLNVCVFGLHLRCVPVLQDGIPGGSKNSLELCPGQVLLLICFCITAFRVQCAFRAGSAFCNQGEINSLGLSYHTSVYYVLSLRNFFPSQNNDFIPFKTVRNNAKNWTYYLRSSPTPDFFCR